MNTKKTSLLWLATSMLLVCGFFVGLKMVYSSGSVTVTAIVWSTNMAPVILSTSPNVSPVVLKRNAIQTFSLKIQDTDSLAVDFTVSSPTGAIIPINGTISDVNALVNGWAYVNFTYFAPSIKPSPQPTITITLSDRTNPPITKNINLYIY